MNDYNGQYRLDLAVVRTPHDACLFPIRSGMLKLSKALPHEDSAVSGM